MGDDIEIKKDPTTEPKNDPSEPSSGGDVIEEPVVEHFRDLEPVNLISEIRIKKNTLNEYDNRKIGGNAQNVYILFDENGDIITDNTTEPDDYTTLAQFLKETSLTINDLAPKDHSSIESIYGLATTEKYGHVKLGYGLKLAEDGSTTLDRAVVISPSDPRLSDAREPISHAAPNSDYGLGTSSYFGHVILSDIYNNDNPDISESGADVGVAASAYALQQAYKTVNDNLANYSTTDELLSIMTSEIDLAVQVILSTNY